jgi:hypothetical protein
VSPGLHADSYGVPPEPYADTLGVTCILRQYLKRVSPVFYATTLGVSPVFYANTLGVSPGLYGDCLRHLPCGHWRNSLLHRCVKVMQLFTYIYIYIYMYIYIYIHIYAYIFKYILVF